MTTTMTAAATDAAAGSVIRRVTLKPRAGDGKETTTVVVAGMEIRRATLRRLAAVGREATTAVVAGIGIPRATPKPLAGAGKRVIGGNRAVDATMMMTKAIDLVGAMKTMTAVAAAAGEARPAIRGPILKQHGGVSLSSFPNDA